jgi:hypothetical protein
MTIIIVIIMILIITILVISIKTCVLRINCVERKKVLVSQTCRTIEGLVLMAKCVDGDGFLVSLTYHTLDYYSAHCSHILLILSGLLAVGSRKNICDHQLIYLQKT